MTTHKSHPSIEVARGYFAAINETRLEDLGNVFAPNAVLKFPMLEPICGRTAIKEFYAGVLSSYPKRFDKVTRWFVGESGDIAAEIHFEGETQTGRPVVFDAVDVFRISDRHILELLIFYDSAKVNRMAGG